MSELGQFFDRIILVLSEIISPTCLTWFGQILHSIQNYLISFSHGNG